MRIAFVANNLRAGGGKVVMENLLPEFLKILGNTKHDVLVVLPSKDIHFENFANIKMLYSLGGDSAAARFLWQKCAMESAVRKFKPDWTFAMGNYGINRLSGRQSVLLQNQNIYSNYARNGSLAYRFITFLKQLQFKVSLRSIDRLYFQTDLIKSDFLKFFPAYSGESFIMPFFIPAEIEAEDCRGAAKESGAFFNLIYPANASIHKNQRIIVSTFAKYKNDLSNTRCYLTIDPVKDELGRALSEIVKKNGLAENIVFTGKLSRKDLSSLYRACDALLMPTMLETLGLPYLESMHFGLPIITTDADFSRAVCGDAAVYCDSLSEASVKDAILKLKKSPEKVAELKAKERDFIKSKVKKPSEIAKEILELEGVV